MADDCLVRAPEIWRCRQDRIDALVEFGQLDDAKREALRLLTRETTMTADQFGSDFSEVASALRIRRVAAAIAAGIPQNSGGSRRQSNSTRQ